MEREGMRKVKEREKKGSTKKRTGEEKGRKVEEKGRTGEGNTKNMDAKGIKGMIQIEKGRTEEEGVGR